MRFHYKLSHFIVRSIAKILFGFQTKGGDKVPGEGKLILAANHQSYLDPPIVGVSVRRELFYLAKAELFKIPLLNLWIRTHNAIPLKRYGFDREAIKRALEVLNRGDALLLFPEGTRSRNGRLQKAKSGIGMIAYHTKTDIIPLHIAGTFKAERGFFKPPRIVVSFGERINIEKYLKLKADKREIYRRIGEDVMEKIKELRVREGGH